MGDDDADLRVARCVDCVCDVLGSQRTTVSSATPGRGEVVIVWRVLEKKKKTSRQACELAIALARDALDPFEVAWRRVGKHATLRARTTTERVAGAPTAAAKRRRVTRWTDMLTSVALYVALGSAALAVCERVLGWVR